MDLSTAHFHVQLLGGFAVATPDGTVSISARKDRWLLAMLLLAGGRPIARQEIQDALWPHGGGDPAYYLRRSLSQLRDALGPQAHRIESPTRTTLRFAFDESVFVDALAFEVGASSPDPERWRDAVSLYTGALLPDCHETWVLGPRQRLHRLHHERVARLAKAALETADVGALEPVLLKALEIDPLWEEGRRLWMRALVVQGQPHEAVRNFQEFVRLLRRESPSQEPEPETLALVQQVRSQARHPAKAPVPQGNLPEAVTRCVGRAREVARVVDLLSSTRMLTLTGAGGCGKTRLAQEVARASAAAFPDGVWWVELAPVSDPALVAATAAAALEVPERLGEPILKTLADAFRGRRALIVLDNCEHQLEASARLVDTLLRRSPHTALLATSREPLRVAGETAFRVPSLGEEDAAQLFRERAEAALPGWSVPTAQRDTVAALCRRLDGIPLAIELAAAQVRAMALPEIARRLDDRFALLTGGSRTAPPRHRTLRALVDWSVDLLDDGEKSLLRRLSVFAGGWTAEAAEAVCADGAPVLGRLVSLVEKSLVVAESEGESTRYHLLETVRQYARERLREAGESEAIRGRHRDHYLAWYAAPPEDPQFLRRRREIDNARAALDFCAESPERAEGQIRLVTALGQTWHHLLRNAEGRDRFLEALEAYGAENRTDLRAQALTGATGFLMYAGAPRHDPAENYPQRFAREALAIYRELGDSAGTAWAHHTLGWCSVFVGDADTARENLEAAFEANRTLGNTQGMRGALFVLAILHFNWADFGAVRRVCRELDALAPGESYSYLGLVLREEGDFANARPILERSVRRAEAGGNRFYFAWSTSNLAMLLHAQGDLAEAWGHFESSLRVFWKMGEMNTTSRVLEAIAALAWDLGSGADAPRLWGAAEGMRRRHHLFWFPLERERYARQSASVRAALGEDAFDAAWAEGLALESSDAVVLALGQGRRSGRPDCVNGM